MSENAFARVNVEKVRNRVPLSKRFWKPYRRGIVVCGVCERRCHIPEGYSGICGNYVNIGGELYDVGYGLVSAVESRPIEIKPLFHFYPNSTALTFSGWGCNLHCDWCQNYHLSMVKPLGAGDGFVRPEALVRMALRSGDHGLCASFNEPTIHLQFIIDVFREGKKRGLYTTIVSNGYMSAEAAKALVEVGLDGLNIDIKGCPEAHKRMLKGIDPNIVYRNAKFFLDHNVHVEMVLLVVPGFNDSMECIEWIVRRHLEVLGPDIPLHINRYYPAYKYNRPPTHIKTLIDAYKIAREYGLKYVYVGNVWEPSLETTYCPRCNEALIVRDGYRVVKAKIKDGRCSRCGEKIYLTGKIYL